MPFVTHDGRKLHYIDRGDGPVVLLAHSFLCSIDMWAAQIEDLSRDHRVIAVDGQEVDLTPGESFLDAHTRVYRRVLAGGGWGIDAVQPGVDLTYRIRTASCTHQSGSTE